MRVAGLESDPGARDFKAPDFVVESRKPGADFIPVGVDAPRPALRARTKESMNVLEADLEKARTGNEAKGRAAETAAKGIGKGNAPPTTP